MEFIYSSILSRIFSCLKQDFITRACRIGAMMSIEIKLLKSGWSCRN